MEEEPKQESSITSNTEEALVRLEECEDGAAVQRETNKTSKVGPGKAEVLSKMQLKNKRKREKKKLKLACARPGITWIRILIRVPITSHPNPDDNQNLTTLTITS